MAFKLPKKDGFAHRVYAKLLKVPKGKVTTYGTLAHAVGTRAYRAVGQVMNRNPYAPDVPCHRVISSNGSLGGFASGDKNKIALLKSEGIELVNGLVPEKFIIREL